MLRRLTRPWLPAVFALALAPAGLGAADALTAVPFTDVKINDAFWSPRLTTNRTATVAANLRQCELTGRVRNFAIAGKLEPGEHKGLLYDDSDVYKVLEGVAYALAVERDPDLEKRADAVIDRIVAAQQPDGYLNTYYTLVKPQERWKNIQYGHELYCAGHLIEAAVAYRQATGKAKLFDAARRFADLICATFGPGKRPEPSGHEEIELALVKLWRATGDDKYLKQARHFLDARGVPLQGRKLFGEYAQDHKPVREQFEVAGHAVRAMYLYCAMADVAAAIGDEGLRRALDRVWHDVVDRKMYVTGGIGPSASNEGFTVPYDLPNDSAYAETCAAIGMALWNHRMFLMSRDGKYADVLEREVYNGLLSGVSLGGDRFFYVNPLGSVGRHHRVPWFGTSCCPTNIVRYLPALGERVYAHTDDAIWTVLYLSNTATVKLKGGAVKLTQTTSYPWGERVGIKVESERPMAFDLYLRVPGWCKDGIASIVRAGGDEIETVSEKPEKGYIRVSRTWAKGDRVWLSLPMPVERVSADPHVQADVGRVALMRGPVVYCVEGADNEAVRNLVLPKDAKLESHFEKDLLGDVAVIEGRGLAVTGRTEDDKPVTKPVRFRAVPYSTWDNRTPGPMAVWLPETPELAEVPGEGPVVESNGVRVSASHLNPTDTLASLNDGTVPKGSDDHSIPRMTWWDHKGTAEWVGYRLPAARPVSTASVYWFDDTGRGGCRVPAEWRLVYKDGDAWKPVTLTAGSAYGLERDRFNAVTFEPVTVRELRIEVKLRDGFSGGVLKWTVR
jgi:DUF1680 family protein